MMTALTIFVLFIAANFGRIYYQNFQVPSLGVTNGEFAPISKKPNNVSTQAKIEEKKVETLAAKATLEETMAAVIKTVEAYGGATVKEQTSDYLYVVFTTSLMKYNDDVEFWIDMANNEVHFRSASRAGFSDMGLNRVRYNKLAELYAAQ